MADLLKEVNSFADLSGGLKSSIIITSLLMIVLTIIGLRVKKLKTSDVPGGITLVSIMLVETVNDMVSGMFKKWKSYAPLVLTVIIFLLFANTITLFGLTAPLSNIMVALSFSIFAFGSIQVVALFVHKPLKRAKSMLEPTPVLLPINLIGELATPLAMGLRLFGNLLSGSIIGIIVFRGGYELAMAVYGWIPYTVLNGIGFGIVQFLGLGVGAFIHAIFDIFFGAIQAYVYFMLFSIFMNMAVED